MSKVQVELQDGTKLLEIIERLLKQEKLIESQQKGEIVINFNESNINISVKVHV